MECRPKIFQIDCMIYIYIHTHTKTLRKKSPNCSCSWLVIDIGRKIEGIMLLYSVFLAATITLAAVIIIVVWLFKVLLFGARLRNFVFTADFLLDNLAMLSRSTIDDTIYFYLKPLKQLPIKDPFLFFSSFKIISWSTTIQHNINVWTLLLLSSSQRAMTIAHRRMPRQH